MSYVPLIIKYNPQNLDNINLYQVTKDIVNVYLENKIMKFFIHGNICSGKSSLINVLLNLYYNNDKKLIEKNTIYINLLKEQGISYYRNEIKHFCEINNFNFNYKKTIVIDDLDLLNEQCQEVFNVFITNYENINFIISCNDILKIKKTIVNKLELIRINNIDKNFLYKILINILNKENISLQKNTIDFIIKTSNLSISNMINMLEKINLIGINDILENDITIIENIICNIMTSDFNEYISLCESKNIKESVLHIMKLYNKGYSVIDIYEEFFMYIKNISTLNDEKKYKIIKLICKYIHIYNNLHEDPIELIFLTNHIINII
jgi:DNA polymerase III gamma/tau subunit